MAKSKYTDDFPLLAEGYARDGLSDKQIAGKLDISVQTYYDYQKRYPEFLDAIKKGKKKPDEEVVNALFKSATGFEYEETISIKKKTKTGILLKLKEKFLKNIHNRAILLNSFGLLIAVLTIGNLLTSENQRKPKMIDQQSKKFTSRWAALRHHPTQYLLKHQPVRFKVVPAGRRSGKTEIAKRFICSMAMTELKPYELRNYFCAAPTQSQAKRIYWNDLKELTKPWWRKPPREVEMIVFLTGAVSRSPADIYVLGMDKPERVEGSPWDGGILDEYANVKQSAWGENVRPALSDRLGWCWLIGVPEGRNHYYDVALKTCGGTLPETKPGVGANFVSGQFGYYSWHSSDILPASEIEAAKDELDEKTYRQEYEAAFEGFEGLAYYPFSKENIDNTLIHDQNKIVYIGMDFNVDPMTATFNHVSTVNGIEIKQQFDEAYLPNSNTFEMVDHIKEKFNISSSNERQLNRFKIYPDSTGKAERSNATRSDIDILKKAGFKIYARNAPPRVKDRVNAYNAMLKTKSGMCRIKVNANTCKHTVMDYNRVERLPDGRLNKAQEKTGLKHISDADGYFVEYKWSLKNRKATATKRYAS